jgi:hypothetical protein
LFTVTVLTDTLLQHILGRWLEGVFAPSFAYSLLATILSPIRNGKRNELIFECNIFALASCLQLDALEVGLEPSSYRKKSA